MKISTHLETKPYQVATSTNLEAEFRKWNHLGTHHRISHRDAAMFVGNGEIVRVVSRYNRVVFEFSDGLFVAVGF